MDKFAKLFKKYIDLNFKSPVEYSVEHNDGKLTIWEIVDISKADLNHANYDPSYRKIFYPKRPKGAHIFIVDENSRLNKIKEDLRKFFKLDIDFWTGFKPINYDYLDNIENKIKEAVKENDYPNIEVEFKGNLPKIALLFSNLPDELKERENMTEYLNNLKLYTKLKYNIDIDSYSLTWRIR